MDTNIRGATVITGNGMDGTEEMTTIGSIAMVITAERRGDTRASMIRASGVTDIMENTRAIEATIINRKFERSFVMCAKPGKTYTKAAANCEATLKS